MFGLRLGDDLVLGPNLTGEDKRRDFRGGVNILKSRARVGDWFGVAGLLLMVKRVEEVKLPQEAEDKWPEFEWPRGRYMSDMQTMEEKS